MYTDKKRKIGLQLLLAALALAAAVLLSGQVRRNSGQDVAQASAAALKAAVERSARQCYVVEGVYPTDLAYLEEHYGLQVNHEDFYIIYDVFASNLPPDVRVTPRAG